MSSKVILVLGILNGILYCCVLPLWEGFDEPFHYAYVQSVARSHSFPVVNRTPISREIRRSLDLVPLSRLFSQAVPDSVSFEQWTKLPQVQKLERCAQLRALSPQLANQPDRIGNYEAQQAPLAYLVYAPLDWLLSPVGLPLRIFCLRIFGVIAATISIFFAVHVLCRVVGLAGAFRLACFAVIFEGQMLWASIAHIGNDVFAVPLTVWLFTWLFVTVQETSPRNILVLSAIFAAGLLTKAYFLAFTPLVLIFAIWLLARRAVDGKVIATSVLLIAAVASPWYLRNMFLYGSLSGTQQSIAGVGVRQALAAIPSIPWSKSLGEFALWSLWTGNWSFLSFSKATLSLEWVLLLAGLFAYLTRMRRLSGAHAWVLAGCICFGLGLAYQTCVTWVHSGGESTHPEPWYGQGVFVVLIVLCFYGFSRSSWLGRGCAAALTVVAAWIALMTYLAKLLPYYGAAISRSNLGTLYSWWNRHPTLDLSTVTLVSPVSIYFLLAIFVFLLLAVTIKLLLQLRPSRSTES